VEYGSAETCRRIVVDEEPPVSEPQLRALESALNQRIDTEPGFAARITADPAVAIPVLREVVGPDVDLSSVLLVHETTSATTDEVEGFAHEPSPGGPIPIPYPNPAPEPRPPGPVFVPKPPWMIRFSLSPRATVDISPRLGR
jgi:hypothetical protein